MAINECDDCTELAADVADLERELQEAKALEVDLDEARADLRAANRRIEEMADRIRDLEFEASIGGGH